VEHRVAMPDIVVAVRVRFGSHHGKQPSTANTTHAQMSPIKSSQSDPVPAKVTNHM